MAPRTPGKNKRHPVTPIPGPRRSARLRAKHLQRPPTSQPPRIRPVHESLTHPAPESRTARNERDVFQEDHLETETAELEGARPAIAHPWYPSPLELSETNLRLFNGEELDDLPNSSSILSRSSSNESPERDTSRSSSSTVGIYRYQHLKAAHVFIHSDTPTDIQDAVDAIVRAEVSMERRAELRVIAQQLHDECKNAVKGAVSEDDFVGSLLIALKAMDHSGLCFRAKADWREHIKPRPQQQLPNISHLTDVNVMASNHRQEVDDASAPPLKLPPQCARPMTLSSLPWKTEGVQFGPDNRAPESDFTRPPQKPLWDKTTETTPIKTPRPDISIGIDASALTSALCRLLNHGEDGMINDFLSTLENTMKPDKVGEPLLTAVPTQRISGLVFPFAVVEGKAYSTGRQVFEAQNQAAVSGASGLKMQLLLNELVERATTGLALPSTTALRGASPLFFSICTEGPYHELWVHYTYVRNGVPSFGQVLLEICNGMLLKGVIDFIIAVDNVLRWGTGEHLVSVVERLATVLKTTGA